MAKKQQIKAKAAKPAKGATSTGKSSSKSSGKSAGKKGVGERVSAAMPDMPSMPHLEVPQGIRDIGTYLSSVLNTDAGRFIMAELLIQVAKALTTKLADTETAHKAADAVREAGGSASDVVKTVGTKAAASAGSALSSGTDLATAARGVAREVAQAAVGAVGGAVVQAAQNMLPTKKGKGAAAGGAPGAAPGPGPGTTIPVSPARPRGTPRPPQLGGSGPRR